jgi:hypothetical protein
LTLTLTSFEIVLFLAECKRQPHIAIESPEVDGHYLKTKVSTGSESQNWASSQFVGQNAKIKKQKKTIKEEKMKRRNSLAALHESDLFHLIIFFLI